MYLKPEGSDSRESGIVASSKTGAGCETGWVCGGVNNGTLFSSRGGNDIPADCQYKLRTINQKLIW